MYHKTYGTIIPLKKRVLVSNMHFGMAKTKAGIILQDDDGSAAGVHPRWAKVYAIGKDQTDVHEGEWVLIAHGRWTRQINLVDPDHHYVPGQMHK
jgi:co-chaperonin GroES (HSP10)